MIAHADVVVISVHVAATSLVCEDVQDLCPDDNHQRMCTCVVSGSIIRWRTDRTGVFDGQSVTFFAPLDPLGTSQTEMGFTVIITNNSVGQLTSIMTYTPAAVSTTGLTVTCEDPNTVGATNMTFLAGVASVGELTNGHAFTSKTKIIGKSVIKGLF